MNAPVVHHGDCIEVMRGMADNTIDAIVTDPPYNLSDSGKRDRDCLRRVISKVSLPQHDQRDTEGVERGDLTRPSVGRSQLGSAGRAFRIHARIGVPVSSVDLDHSTVSQHEINTGNEPAALATDGDLPSELNPESGKGLCNFVLQLADGVDLPFCDSMCGCFTEPGQGLIAMRVSLSSAAGGDGSGVMLGSQWRGDPHVGVGDDALRQSQCAPGVVAGPRAVMSAVLCLDLRRGTGELHPASGAGAGDLPFFQLTPQGVGTTTGTGSLAPPFESPGVGQIGDLTHGAFSLDFPAHEFNSTVAKGFMGKAWDGWQSPASFQRWCTAWTTECLRILKPGGHLLAFGGTRTWHRLAAGIEDAGFEIRDSIAWLYGSGFPKSLDVSKAIDKAAGAAREVIGASNRHVGKVTQRLEGLNGSSTFAETPGMGGTITAPATDAARQWQGWGTAMKPAFEPVVCARKPLAKGMTVSANVIAHGTGALNIDACRIEGVPPSVPQPKFSRDMVAGFGASDGRSGVMSSASGRWPANVALSEDQAAALDQMSAPNMHSAGKARDSIRDADRTGMFPMPGDGNRFGDSGGASRFFFVAPNQQEAPHVSSVFRGVDGNPSSDPGLAAEGVDSPTGPTQPRFMYVAKAPARERPKVDGVAHPTVKPIALMRWLVKLVTPTGGTILDPFAGSGTTIEAAMLEGFNVVGIEREADYLPLIQARIDRNTYEAPDDRYGVTPPGLFDIDGEASA